MSPEAANRQIVICGLGGQGIVFLSRVVAQAALRDGEAVLTAETHGMSQRGGAVEAHLKLGDFASSLVRPGSADAAIALDASRLEVARGMLKPGGTGFANAVEAASDVHWIDAAAAARALGFPRGVNLVLLGFAAAVEPSLFPTADGILDALEALSPPAAREGNREAFAHGAKLVRR